MMKENYGRMFGVTLAALEAEGVRPKLLLHACCAPCSSHVLEVTARYFDLTLYFYNPNISPEEEFRFRLSELERFVREVPYPDVKIAAPEYDAGEFFGAVRGMEDLPEGGKRCRVCYELRLRKTAEAAKAGGFDCFTTTLSISPYKNAQWLNEIGGRLAEEYGISYLFSDFKKKNGYRRSIELSREYGLYRQNYCGCVYSKIAAEKVRAERNNSPALS